MSWLSNRLGLRRPKRRQQTALDQLWYSDSVSLGKSPTIPDIEWLARKAGFRALLSLNTEGEPGQILSPNVEATWAHTFEMHHGRASIDSGVLPSGGVDKFLETLQEIAKPVYVHSLQGRRAAALISIHLALERRLSGDKALEEARLLGIDCAVEQLRLFTASEVDSRLGTCESAATTRPAGSSAPAGVDIESRSSANPGRVASRVN